MNAPLTTKKTTKKMTKKKTNDPIQEQRDAFIKANSVPEEGLYWEQIVYRWAVARFPYPDQKKGMTVYLD
jgi:hypothetical protein